jgi:hypothetical protein
MASHTTKSGARVCDAGGSPSADPGGSPSADPGYAAPEIGALIEYQLLRGANGGC